MSPDQSNKLKLLIFLKIEACCRKKGLIKKHNGHEMYEEGLESFIDKLCDEIYNSYQKERAGEKKPFFTGPKGLKGAIGITCHKRINDFLIEKKYLRRIYERHSSEEYIFSLHGNFEPYNDANDKYVDVARAENLTRFGEPVKGYNQSPESILEEAELKEVFEKEHEKLLTKGKDGPLYYNAIEFYLYGHNANLHKKDEISALSAFLGVDRKKTIEVKCRARKYLFDRLSEWFELDKCKKSMQHKRELEKLFKKISYKKLLKICDTRYSLFLNPYLGHKIACTIRELNIYCNKKGQKVNSPSTPANVISSKTSKFNKVA